MEKTNLTPAMESMFSQYTARCKDLQKQHELENEEQERLFWKDPGVIAHIPRVIFKQMERKYFGWTRERHRAELDELYTEYGEMKPRTDDDGEYQSGEDGDYNAVNPMKITNLAEVHVLTANEQRYADYLIAEFAKNNLAVKPVDDK